MSAFTIVNKSDNVLNYLFDFSRCSLDNARVLHKAIDVIKNTFRGRLLLASLACCDIKKIIFCQDVEWKMQYNYDKNIAIISFPDFYNSKLPSVYCLINDRFLDIYPNNKIVNFGDLRVISAMVFHELFHIIQLTEKLALLRLDLNSRFPNISEQQATEAEDLYREEINLSKRKCYESIVM